jgi:hypothetical protein
VLPMLKLTLLTNVASIEKRYTGRFPYCKASACQNRQPQPYHKSALSNTT